MPVGVGGDMRRAMQEGLHVHRKAVDRDPGGGGKGKASGPERDGCACVYRGWGRWSWKVVSCSQDKW